ncbi:MAG TPA: ATP-binding protein [Solimonas sp.]|nr:ATP-binding protein [Solimonas sp.]
MGEKRGQILQVLSCLLLWLLAQAAAAAEPISIVQGEFLPQESLQLPADNDPRWRPVELPDQWVEPDRFKQGSSGWYRFQVTAPASVDEPWALYFLRGGINLAAYFNRSFVGDGGRFEEPIAFNANRPLLFTIPSTLLAADGRNVVHVYLRGYPYFVGMYPFDVGELQQLRPRYERRVLLQTDLGFGLMLLTLVSAMFSFTLYLRNREQAPYLWFAVCAAFWAVFGANMSVRDLPVPGRYWLALIHSSIDWSCAMQMLFVHRFLDVRRPLPERLMLAVATLGTLCNFLGSWWTLRYLGSLFNFLSLTSLVYGFWFAGSRWRHNSRADVTLLCVGLALQLLFATHDYGLAVTRSADWYRNSIFMMHFVVPLFLTALGWRLLDRTLSAPREMAQLNQVLETRVSAARLALEQAFDERCRLERQQAALDERERIHRDLHDDLGAKLLTLLHSGENEASVDLARGALNDLREVVTLNPQDAVSLRGTLSEMQGETVQRALRAGVQLQWRYPPGVDVVEVPAGYAYHLTRILREAVSNALRHGGTPAMDVTFRIDGSSLWMRVADEGRGLDGSRPGLGMRNMCDRTEALRGSIHWRRDGGGGTVVELRVPLPEEGPKDSLLMS